MTQETLIRYRIHFHKDEHLRFIGHLDLHRTMERTLRRSKLPLDYSKGFNPRVRLNLSTALPLGCTSIAEFADIWLLSDLETDSVLQALSMAAPPGLPFISVEKIDYSTPALQSQIFAAEYQVDVGTAGAQAPFDQAAKSLLDAAELPRTRRNKPYDLRPLLQELEVKRDQHGKTFVRMVLKVGEGSTGRPEEVLLALGLDPADTFIQRTQVFLEGPPA